ncbi:MAG: response regulator [Ferrovum sp.]|nr:response regulator [Ferrovum sp.]
MGKPFKDRFAEHLAKCDRVELEQSLIRLGMGLAILVYLLYRYITRTALTYNDIIAFKILGIFLLLALILFSAILSTQKTSVIRRLAGAWIDQGGTTLFMAFTGEVGVMLVGVYLWVIFGNGFRFGKKYLFHAQLLSMVGFLVTIQINPYWQNHPSIAYSVLVMLFALPIYVSALINRMNEARQKAEEASAAKTRFVANMSHEIRTPLNGIIGIGTLLKTTPLNNEQQDLLGMLNSSSKLLLSLLNNVLDFAKIEDGKMTVERTDFSVVILLEETAEIFRSQAEAEGLHLDLCIAAGVGRLRGDPLRLQQVLANLVGNAVKFTERGSITLSLSVLGNEEHHTRLRFEVADTGVGIPLSAQAKIFESFNQADISTSRRFGGSGLGLTITKHLVEAMGGHLSVDSTEGLGSRFWFDLTLENAAQSLSSTAPLVPLPTLEESGLHAPLHILVCENDATNQKILLRLLELAGQQASLTCNGEEMLDRLEHATFDLVIADLNMAGMSGIEALKIYRFSRPDDTHTRFILFTADVTLSARNAAQEAGFDAFLGKPVDAPMLFGTIANLLGLPSTTAEHWLNTAMGGSMPSLSTSASENTGTILDASTLQELETLGAGDALFVHRLLRNYLRDSDELLDKIDQAIQHKHYGALRDHCHALKGNSLGIGATAVFTRAEAIDQAETGELRFRGCAMTELLHEDYAMARNAIEGYLSRRQTASN